MMIYTFADCQLDADRRELRRDGILLSLRPKVFDMLTLLIEQRNRVVSKDELLERVWTGRYISETTLSSCLKELRKALGDDGKKQNVIKTVRGQGFRFIATLKDTTRDSHTSDHSVPAAADARLNPVDQVPSALHSTSSDKVSATAPSSEHKNVSVLRCGLVDAADLSERLDPETMHYLLQDLFAIAEEVIRRFNGQVTQWLSDGFVALFGAPVAHEDHARCALLAAFELLNRSQYLGQEQQAYISFGLSSGAAIVSRLPSNPEQCYTAISSVVRLAETLQTQADAGRVLISADSYRLLRADVRVRALEGRSDALLVDHVVAQRAGVPRRFRRHMAPLIGRTQELSLLHQRLAQAEAGDGQSVTIIGNPGIGKSRLLSEFQQELSNKNIRYLQANCFPHFHGTPYYLLAEYLRRCCGIDDGDTEEAIQDKLRLCLQAAELTQPETLPLLLKLLELPHDTLPLEQLSAQAQRDRTSFYLQRLLLNGRQTTVIALEDHHWMDASSQAWLDSLIRRLANQRVLLITTCRPGFNPDWLTLPWVSQLALLQLNQEHCLSLLRLLPRAAALQNRLVELATLSGGNPFFLEELAMNAASAGDSIPDTVQGVLTSRIDQLALGDKILLQAAAIIGQSGPLKLLEAVSALNADEMENALLRLQCAELLFNEFAHGEPMFAFKNALVQEVVYANQLCDQRQSMHARVAGVLHNDFPELVVHRPEFMAYHCDQAGRNEDAVRYWQRAARKAYERSAYVEAIDYVNKGLALLERFDDPAARAANELALQRTLGPALVATRGYGAAEVEHTWVRARQLCEELQDHSALFRVLIGLGNYYLVAGNFVNAFDGNRQLFRLARRAHNDNLLLRAKAAMGELMMHSGRMRSAKRYFDHCLALIASNEQPLLSSQISAVVATGQAAWVYWYLQQETVALTYAERALQQARALQRPFTLAIALSLSAELHRFRDDPHSAMKLAQEGAAISREQTYPYWHGSTLVTLGWAEARTGDVAKGIGTIRQGIEVFRATGAKLQLTSWLGALADAYQIAGQIDTALATIDEAIAWAERTGDCYYLPQLFRLQSRLFQLQGNGENTMKIPD